MKKEIKTILADIYRVAPELKEREAEIVAIIESLMTNRPDAQLDERFRDELREKIIAKLSEAGVVRRTGFWTNWSRYLASATAGGAVVAAALLITLSGGMSPSRQKADSLSRGNESGSAVMTTKLADGAFGSLTGAGDSVWPADNAAAALDAATAEQAPTAAPVPVGLGAKMGGGGMGVATSIAYPAVERIMEVISNVYRYDGDIDLPDSPITVTKAVNEFDDTDLNRAIAGISLGSFNLGRLNNLKVNQLTVSEGDESGFNVNFNAMEGAIHLNQNWNDAAYSYQNSRLTENDIPTDSALLAIADGFVRKYGIDLSDFGEPTVMDEWRLPYLYAKTVGQDAWIPEMLQVIYPMLIDGMPVVDDYGNPQGMTVSVNIRTMQVTHAGPIYLQSFQTSGYPAVSDLSTVRAALSRGGIYAWEPSGVSSTQYHDVAAPKRVMLQRFTWKNNESQRLFIPALQFDVEGRTAESFGNTWVPQAIVLPLAAEFYEVPNRPQIEPMPLIEPMSLRMDSPAPEPEPTVAPPENR